MDLKLITKREERERDGVWIKLNSGIPDEKAEVLVTSLDLPRYTQGLYMRAMPLREKYGKDIPQDDMDRIIAECICDYVLLDWKGIENGDQPLPYSKEIAREWLMKSKAFLDMISGAAIRASRMLEDQFQKDLADLKKASAPASPSPKARRTSRG